MFVYSLGYLFSELYDVAALSFQSHPLLRWLLLDEEGCAVVRTCLNLYELTL